MNKPIIFTNKSFEKERLNEPFFMFTEQGKYGKHSFIQLDEEKLIALMSLLSKYSYELPNNIDIYSTPSKGNIDTYTDPNNTSIFISLYNKMGGRQSLFVPHSPKKRESQVFQDEIISLTYNFAQEYYKIC